MLDFEVQDLEALLSWTFAMYLMDGGELSWPARSRMTGRVDDHMMND